MNKVIIKTALKTLLILIIVALAAFAVASFGFPQHMATFFENTENYTLATKYASLRYSYTGEVDDAARCVEDSILSGDNDDLIQYCEIFVNHSDFDTYCTQMDEYYSTAAYSSYTLSYKQYIYGKYAVALAVNGQKQDAVNTALNANGLHSFKSGNAVSVLALWAAGKEDGETCSLIAAAMESINAPEDAEYYNDILQIVKNAAA